MKGLGKLWELQVLPRKTSTGKIKRKRDLLAKSEGGQIVMRKKVINVKGEKVRDSYSGRELMGMRQAGVEEKEESTYTENIRQTIRAKDL